MKSYSEYKLLIDEELKKLFDSVKKKDNYSLSPLTEAMSYSVLNGGKRLRPVSLLMTADIFGGDIESVLPLALGLELIQGYSLVHDDMPCMDDDELRRGKPTTHKAFGEAMGLLAGDALLNLAAEVVSAGAVDAKDKEAYCKAMNYLFVKSGYLGMAGGQGVDVYTEKYHSELITEEVVFDMYKGKTAALFNASVCCGAIASGASQSQISSLEKFSTALGIAFQLKDDLLDVVSTVEVLGKDVNSDKKNSKKNIFSFKTAKEVEDLCGKYTKEALISLKEIDADCSALTELTENLLEREF